MCFGERAVWAYVTCPPQEVRYCSTDRCCGSASHGEDVKYSVLQCRLIQNLDVVELGARESEVSVAAQQ